jgi:hypothetical protein
MKKKKRKKKSCEEKGTGSSRDIYIRNSVLFQSQQERTEGKKSLKKGKKNKID